MTLSAESSAVLDPEGTQTFRAGQSSPLGTGPGTAGRHPVQPAHPLHIARIERLSPRGGVGTHAVRISSTTSGSVIAWLLVGLLRRALQRCTLIRCHKASCGQAR